MTKDVILTISGLQFAQEMEVAPVEIVTAGNYYKKNGKHYIVYEEVMEGFEGTTKNIIKLTEDYLDITKKGIANVHMVFEKNKKNMTYYQTPFGSLFIGIDAEDVQVQESDDNIDVNVAYALEANYEHLADCRIRMNIKSKDAGGFRLQ
jgi:uncharacterized beta-barrel protein YwiB (DUF1934 family)